MLCNDESFPPVTPHSVDAETREDLMLLLQGVEARLGPCTLLTIQWGLRDGDDGLLLLELCCDAPPPSWVLLLSRLRVLCRVSGGSAGSRVPAAAAVCVCPERDDLLYTSARVYSSDYAP